MEEKLRVKILNYMERHNTLTLATTDGEQPWAAALFYVNDGFNLYFLSKPDSRHCQNLTARPQVAVTINEDYRNWQEIRGVQLKGRAYPVTGKLERAKATALYLKKYPFVKNFYLVPAFKRVMSKVELYKIVPEVIWFVDNSGGHFNRQKLLIEGY